MTATLTTLTLTFEERSALAKSLDVPACLNTISNQEAAAAIAAHKGKALHHRSAAVMDTLTQAHPDIEEYTDGGTRAVYHVPGSNAVVKVPYFQCDAQLNQLEVSYYEQDQFGYPVIPCRLVWTDTAVPLVVMEYCTLDRWEAPDMPDWGRHADGWQITRSALLGNQWAAYDAGWPAMDSVAFKAANGVENDYRRLVNSALQLEGTVT